MSEHSENILNELAEVSDPRIDLDHGLPDRTEIIYLLKEIQVVLFPGYFHFSKLSQEQALVECSALLEKLIRRVYLSVNHSSCDARKKAQQFIHRLPEVKKLLYTDVEAIYDGDPAANSWSEVILCYPGFYAILIYRIAHELYVLNIPFIPRVMTEYAHEKTGVDINPGASIGSYFCIDHGTGIVIGETAILGSHVKLYQGVTLGAKSFELDEHGNPVKGGKRHPNIGNNVVIYANATILGGDTYIGDNCVIGGNVWLIHSVPAEKKVYYSAKED